MSENMIFCAGDGKFESSGRGYQKNYQVFNKQLTKTEWEKVKSELPNIELPLTKWIDKKDMTKEEKDDNSVWKELGGYLKVLSYEDAWKSWWDNASQKDKNKILDCSYFDSSIFKEITGLSEKESDGKKKELLTKADELIEQAKLLRIKAEELKDEEINSKISMLIKESK